ncbi:EAL domain-containing protein [Vibrio aquaticus]|uniref:EAL domain-containing protein n=1 Tax=Vibrio aquaticus TaxID=2496559 RepID=A0A432CZV4_9VIBR|nr:EAL domain-containing protein [Vibrio aquaticus]RTZ16794.1 EAL domain-containing protein [Vibrio aquaticus]
MKKKGFKGHLIFATVCVVTLVCALNFVLYSAAYKSQSEQIYDKITKSVEASLQKKVEQQAIALSHILSQQAFNPLYHYNVSETLHLLQTNLSQPNVEVIQIIDQEGLIFHDGTPDIVSFGLPHKKPELIEQVLTTGGTIKRHEDNLLLVAAPIAEQDNFIGVVYLELNKHSLINEVNNSAQQLSTLGQLDSERMNRWQLLFSGVGLICGIAMAYSVASSFANPITQIIKQLKQTRDGRFEPIEQSAPYQELDSLVDAFNEMQHSVSKHNDHIQHMAFHDQLTGLPNRFRFIQLVDDHIAQNQDQLLALLFIDLDDFKFVNDNYGHHVGDDVIKQVCARLNRLLDEPLLAPHKDKVLLSRVGGDEFILMVPYTRDIRITAIADTVLKAIIEPLDLQRFKLSCNASLGIACYPDFGTDADTLCRNAELAMFEQKQKGKNAYSIYTREMDKAVEERLYIEQELRKAMDDLSQFELWYQPKFDIKSRSINGAEALVRWNHPTQGYIGPDKFIPVAESTDLILTLGEHLIHLAAKQASIWRQEYGQHFYIALNLSPRQLHRQNLSQLFKEVLATYELPGSSLHVEVTETLLLSDSAKIKTVLSDLRNLGLKVWLDDFGTGYSSLSYLQEYQFDGVKIDRSFIFCLSPENENTSLIEAILSIAESMGMNSVAEGIETEHQLALLNQLGCKLGQGYLISRPLPVEEFDKSNETITELA